MTRDEAIAELKRDIELDNDFTEDYLNAVNMAIKALEQERSRSAEITQYRHECEKLMEENERLKKALEQEPMLDKIRAEINSPNRGTCDYFIVDRIEEIIDKYKAESEDKE